jgi:hypothetical protein
MPFAQRLNPEPAALRGARLLLVFTLALTAVACGPKLITGRAPFVSIAGMALEGGSLETAYDIANQNGVKMNIDELEVRVVLESRELVHHLRREKLPIDANSSERVTDRSEPDEFALNLLRSLENGDTDSLPFSLEGRVHTLEDGYLRFEQKGHLYRVPGRPGQFRAAVMQASELVREDKL